MRGDRGGRPATIRLDRRTAAAVASGHPWVWRDAVAGSSREPGPGEEVVLLDAVGGFLARGLAEGPDGDGPAVRVISRDERDPGLKRLLHRRIAAARRLRERVVSPGTTAFRLLHGEGDELPGLVVDRYGPVLVVRPDSAAWDRHIGDVLLALRSEGGPGISSIVLRGKRGEGRTLHGDDPPDELEIAEDGRRYLVRPGRGQKTGFFLDQRPNRTAVQALARPGDRAINLFSYTGGFSLSLALGGASHVLSVDVSASILDDCRRQFVINGLDPAGHAFAAHDIFEWLPRFAPGNDAARFDVAVCDPPALAHGRDEIPAARAASRRLHEGLAPLLVRQAILVTCSCTSRLDPADLLDDAVAGLRQGGRHVARVLASAGAGPDHPIPPAFPEGRYLACLTLLVE